MNVDTACRLLEVIDSMGMKDAQISERTREKITRSQLSRIRNGKGGVSMTVIYDFLNAFPMANANYIFTGQGEIFNSTSDTDVARAVNIMLNPSQTRQELGDIITRLKDISASRDKVIEALTDKIIGL